MPTYVYECKSCEKVFEIEQRITEEPLKDCGCGAQGLVRRLIQPVGVMFKGSGFHVNDYSGSASPASAETSCPTPEVCGPEGCAARKDPT
ncbi:MAG TPA: zinc ribbon domain-containing protein [Fimbriimonadaceae bacterium]|nr:zinc ribbon domain-containing protein [Fimbriimonadaceae bacterium]